MLVDVKRCEESHFVSMSFPKPEASTMLKAIWWAKVRHKTVDKDIHFLKNASLLNDLK